MPNHPGKSDLQQLVTEGRRQRSIAIWRTIDAVASLPARLTRRHDKGAAPKCDPSKARNCAA